MIKPFHAKKVLARIFDLVYINNFLLFSQMKFFSPYIRSVFYHDISPSEADRFEQQLKFFAKYYSPVDQQDLIRFHENTWEKDKPGLILTFDDGYRSACEVVAPLLEKYGFTGWFFIAPELIDVPVNEQPKKAREHRIWPKPTNDGSSRVFLTWEQILELDQNHVIGCHTLSHCRLTSALPEDQYYREIVKSKQILESRLKHEITAFAWVGGEEKAYSRSAAELIRKANYQFVFLTNNAIIKPCTNLHLLNRTNIESHFPQELVRFQLSGFLDMMYTLKRRRVSKLITGKIPQVGGIRVKKQ